jgi:hypothetical protein
MTRAIEFLLFALTALAGEGCGSSSGAAVSLGAPDGAATTADAGSTNASNGPDGSCAGTLVCDDFEGYSNGSPPHAPWSVVKNSGSVLIDRTRAHSGTQSVMVTAPAASGFRSVLLRFASSTLLPTAGNVIYGRMMFWLDSAPNAEVHWTFIDGEGLVSTDAGVPYHAVSRYGGQMPLTDVDGGFLGSQLMASYDTPDSYSGIGPSSDCYQQSMQREVPVAQWTCAEWQFDGPNDTMRFWINGVPVPDLTVAMTGDGCTQQPTGYVWAAPRYAELDVGWESYQADDARTIWLDDVALGSERIGCP